MKFFIRTKLIRDKEIHPENVLFFSASDSQLLPHSLGNLTLSTLNVDHLVVAPNGKINGFLVASNDTVPFATVDDARLIDGTLHFDDVTSYGPIHVDGLTNGVDLSDLVKAAAGAADLSVADHLSKIISYP